MRLIPSLLMLACAAAPFSAAYALETTAGSTLQTQANWTALKNLVDAANARTEVIKVQVDKMLACSNAGKIYAPANEGADDDGCISFSTDRLNMESRTVSGVFSLDKKNGMDVNIDCELKSSWADSYQRLTRDVAYLDVETKSAGWKRIMFHRSYSTHKSQYVEIGPLYAWNIPNDTVDGPTNVSFYDDGGKLFTYDESSARANGTGILNKKTLATFADWTGRLRSYSACTVKTTSLN